MNSRERVWAAINHEKVDRVPTDIWATGEVWDKLHQHFGPDVDICAALHIDGFGGVGTKYVGPALPAMPQGESVDTWGMRYRAQRYETGTYMEQYFYPLAQAKTIQDLDQYAWPRADWNDFSQMHADALMARQTKVVQFGYMAPFYFHNKLRGLETSLMDPYEDPAFTHALLQRLSDNFYEYHRRGFEAAQGLIEVCQVTDDFGSQTGPMISLETFRTFYKPHIKRFIDLCKGFKVKVFHHDDGAMRTFLSDLVELGIDILNPIQHVCPGMEMDSLKREFGHKLCFHGAIENQRILPFGTPVEVRAEVRRAIDTLASDGTGYILASCHNLQAVTPVENILAMYDEAYHYGRF